MKFIGQYIQQFIARFRADVYLEGVTESAQDHIVGIDADGKLYKQDVPVGDITGVTAGDALTGGGTSGTVTINHEDTSSQASVDNSGSTFIQDVALDTYGHVTGLTSVAVPTLNQDTTGSSASCTGQAATVATIAGLAPNTATTAAAQPNITSLGTLTSLNVDDVNINGGIITITGSTDDTFFIRTTTDGETIFQTTDTAAAAAHMNFNPDGEFRVTSDDTIFKSNTSAHPTVKIQNQAADATSGELVFYNERHGGNGVGNDELGSIHFKGPNGDRSDAEFNFASIIGKNLFPNDTDETGLLEIKVATSDGSTSALQSGITMVGHPIANAILMTLGYSTTCTTVVSGNLAASKRRFSKTTNTDGTHDGDVVYLGSTTSMTTGAIYFYNSSGNWELTDADGVGKSSGLLAVALGAASDTNGMLLRGMVTLNHDPGAVGDVLYLSTTGGQCSSTAPSGGGDIIRIVGYCLDASNGQIWFNPDNTFVEYTT